MWTDELDEIFNLITELAEKMETTGLLKNDDPLGNFNWVYDMQIWRDSIIDPIEDEE